MARYKNIAIANFTYNYCMSKFAMRLKELRKTSEMTQNALAKLAGMKQQSISWWEANQNVPKITECIIPAKFYGISIDKLVGFI